MGEPRSSSEAAPIRESVLERERTTYEAHKSELLKEEGRFVVIRGDEIAGIWPTFEAALEAGYGRYGLVPFLVKQILVTDPVYTLTRVVFPCPT